MFSLNKNVELKASFEWIKNGFHIFRESPLQFIALAVISTLLSILPLVGALMTPVFTARFAVLAATIEQRNFIRFSEILNDLFSNPEIRKLSLINFVFAAILLVLQYLLKDLHIISDNFETMSGQLGIIIFVIPAILMQMAMWLSPIICLHDKVDAVTAMKLSFQASMYNIPTLLLYGVLAVAFTLLSILPVGLGLLIWIPVANISYYFASKSLFATT